MEKLLARYSDGKTSRLYDAQIWFSSQTINISYKNEDGQSKNIYWDVNKINFSKHGYSFTNQLTYGEFPFEILHVDDLFYTEFQTYFPEHKLIDKSTKLIKHKTWKTILASFLVVALFTIGMYFYVVPELADHLAKNIPIKLESKLGESIYQQNMLAYTIDSAKTKQVNEYFKALNIASNYPINITVVDFDEINAFAMPGGHIVIYSGMLKQMKKQEELAGVLAHEYAHIYYRHSLRALARSLANYTLLSLVIGDVSGFSGVLIENADNIHSLKYSRELETQADDYAFALLESKHINPEGMIWLFEGLQKIQAKKEIQIDVPEFLSSHPETKHRIEKMKEKLKLKHQKFSEDEKLQTLWGKIKSTE